MPGRRALRCTGKLGSESNPQPPQSHRHLSAERVAPVKPKDNGERQGFPAVPPEGDGEREYWKSTADLRKTMGAPSRQGFSLRAA